jgi:hypothetical protein
MLLTGLGVLAATATWGQRQPATYSGLAVCPRPGERCDSPQKRFEAFELPLRLPRRLKANALYESTPFYAVVLRRDSDPACDGGEYSIALERFRMAAQTRFPGRKVFADHQCPNMTAVGYQFIGERLAQNNAVSFVAVYAGKSRTEGRSLLETARKHYPKVTLHQMRVNYSWIVQ